jgi:hypothetical protein
MVEQLLRLGYIARQTHRTRRLEVIILSFIIKKFISEVRYNLDFPDAITENIIID